jgi:hypothetical protein
VLCTAATAHAQVLAQARLQPIAQVIRYSGGVDRVLCNDLDRDGVGDMAFSVASGGTAGDMWWVALRRVGARWQVVKVGQGYKLGVSQHGSDIDVRQPAFRANDPNCCPTGGTDHVRWRWNGARLIVHRRWHTPS